MLQPDALNNTGRILPHQNQIALDQIIRVIAGQALDLWRWRRQIG